MRTVTPQGEDLAAPKSVAAAPTGGCLRVVASDLDRTLIYSRSALGLSEGHNTDLVCVEYYDGGPWSYMTRTAANTLTALAQVSVFVPTTTRTRDQLARVTLPGPAPRFAIAANGGFLLVEGQADPDWSAQVAETLAGSAEPLPVVWEHLRRVCDPAWTRNLRQAEELFAYVVVERALLPQGFANELAVWAAERGWGTSLQGRKLYLVPHALTKGAAVAEVARRVGADQTLAAGDSLLDAEMLVAATWCVRPGHGELAETHWGAGHVSTTARTGVLAGEDIAAWLLKTALSAA